jgi:predicted esterase
MKPPKAYLWITLLLAFFVVTVVESFSIIRPRPPRIANKRNLPTAIANSKADDTTCTSSSSSPSSSIMSKPRILCLHGKSQTAESFSKKISGARRKLERAFELTFLDGPIDLEDTSNVSVANNGQPIMNTGRAWFLREPLGSISSSSDESMYRYTHLDEAVQYVVDYADKNGPYDAIIGFSQGGTFATALATSGAVPVRAVLTAGAPCVDEAFDAASEWVRLNRSNSEGSSNLDVAAGLTIPKLHLAGETDAMIPTESTARLTERGGNGEMAIHEKGHLFPTRALHVDKMVEFLKLALALEEQ